jgi:two-component system OmpR family response regulator/two-component system response regulator RstA
MPKSRSANRPRVLLVEDDEQLVCGLLPHLHACGFEPEHETRGDTAVTRILATQPDVVVLDLSLPGKDGADVCREVRPAYGGIIVALTKRATELDHILALEYGADDFLAKPVDPPILLAHVRAALRRSRGNGTVQERQTPFRLGELEIDRLSRTVRVAGDEIALTTAEFDLLWLLASRAGEVVSRRDIRAELRGLDDGGIDRTMDMRVSRLRRLLGDDAATPCLIKTVRGKGYLFNPSGSD